MKAAEFRKAIAVMMMSVMLITCMPAWADVETATVAVNAETEDLEVTVEAIRVIEVTPEMDRTVGLEVSADGHDAEAKVEKGIVAQGENNPGENTQGTAGIVMKTGGEGSEAEAEIGDEGVSVKDTRVAVGIEMNMSSGSEAEAEVSGSVEATAVSPSGESSNAVGVAVDLGQCGNSSVEVKIYGDIEATGGNTATGLEFGTAERPIENNTANVRVDGDINAKTIYDDQRSGDGALGIHAEGIAGKAAVTVNGLVNATGQNSATAVFAGTNCEEDRIEVAVGGNITAVAGPTEGTTATGITATLNKGSMEMNVGGGVTAAAAGERGSAAAIRVANIVEDGKSGEVEITVEGNVQSTGKAISICGDGIYDQRERVTLEGTAEVKEEEFLRSEYRIAEDHNGTEETKVYYNAEGDYYYDEYGTKWRDAEAEDGRTKIEVKGDVTGDDVGLYVNAQALTDVIVDGTLEGGSHAVVIADESIEANLTLTVWEIKMNEDSSVAELGRMDENGELQTTESDAVEQRIQYIIRLEQPEAGAILSTNGTFDYEGYTVAREWDNVVLKVELEPGYEIADAFNGTDTKVSLLKNEEGEYCLVIPRGGAVLLSVELRKIEERAEVPGTLLFRIETDKPSKTDEPVTETKQERKTVTVTIDPNGGMLPGRTTSIIRNVARGAEFKLPDQPEKDGEIFLGWYCTEYPRTDARWTAPPEGFSGLLKAGTRVKVSSDCFFTAVWKTAE